MTRKDKKAFNQDCEYLYKGVMTSLGLRWCDKLSTEEIRAELSMWITKHNHERLMDNAKRNVKLRKQRAGTIKELKAKVEKLKGLVKEEKQEVIKVTETNIVKNTTVSNDLENCFDTEETDVFKIV